MLKHAPCARGRSHMLRVVKNNLRSRTASLLKNDRAALKNDKGFKQQSENASKQKINNVISITPFLKRDAGFGGYIA